MSSDAPTHALIELTDPGTQYLAFRPIQGDSAAMAALFRPIIARNRKLRSAREMVVLLGLHPSGPTPELIDSPADIPPSQRKYCRRYVIHFDPFPVLQVFRALDPSSSVIYQGGLIGFVSEHYAPDLRTVSKRTQHEKQMERQRRRRRLQRGPRRIARKPSRRKLEQPPENLPFREPSPEAKGLASLLDAADKNPELATFLRRKARENADADREELKARIAARKAGIDPDAPPRDLKLAARSRSRKP